MGLCRAGVGRLLGLGSGLKRITYALDIGNRLPAFSYDPGKKRYVEGMEYGLDHLCLSNDHLWNFYHSQRPDCFCPFFRGIYVRLVLFVLFLILSFNGCGKDDRAGDDHGHDLANEFHD